MSPEPMLPDDPRLARVAEELQKTRWATLICDSEWRLVWVSDELKALIGEEDEGKLGYGKHLVECWLGEPWLGSITPDSQIASFVNEIPYMLHDTPGGEAELCRIIDEGLGVLPGGATSSQLPVEAAIPPALWADSLEFLQGDLPPAPINYVFARLHDIDREFIGTAVVYGSGLPARVLSLVARGDEEMYRRMSRLIDPGRRQAAILFADLEGSGILSRRLPSATYFNLIRALTTAIDELVARHSGIVGKHAGDGVTAFFLADDLGSPSRAARAAIETARSIETVAKSAAEEMGPGSGLISPDDCAVNVGAHWGGTLYMGQVVTGGRLEVTALGDSVTECARIQQTASGGAVLASKPLVEHLTDDDARAIGLDPDDLLYRTLAELPDCDEKSARDAGTIPVTTL